MTPLNLDVIPALMRRRDHFSDFGRTDQRIDMLRVLADEVPGLVAEVVRLRTERDEARAQVDALREALAALGHEAQQQMQTPEVATRTLEQAAAKSDFGHLWLDRAVGLCCLRCGVVRRSDGANKPCRGPAHVTLREGQP